MTGNEVLRAAPLNTHRGYAHQQCAECRASALLRTDALLGAQRECALLGAQRKAAFLGMGDTVLSAQRKDTMLRDPVLSVQREGALSNVQRNHLTNTAQREEDQRPNVGLNSVMQDSQRKSATFGAQRETTLFGGQMESTVPRIPMNGVLPGIHRIGAIGNSQRIGAMLSTGQPGATQSGNKMLNSSWEGANVMQRHGAKDSFCYRRAAAFGSEWSGVAPGALCTTGHTGAVLTAPERDAALSAQARGTVTSSDARWACAGCLLKRDRGLGAVFPPLVNGTPETGENTGHLVPQ